MKHKEPCGCTHDGRRWLTECVAHKAENDELHARAQADNKRSASPTIKPYGEGLHENMVVTEAKKLYAEVKAKDWLEL